MKLIIGELYKVGNTQCRLREVKVEYQAFYGVDKKILDYMCLMVNEDGFEKWVYRESLSKVGDE